MKECSAKKILPEDYCHYDPALNKSEGIFGQHFNSQEELVNNGVDIDDLFLFFGFYRNFSNSRKKELHHLFGWLQIDRIVSGDKAISVGERSRLYAKNINISDSYVGVASKDFSSVVIQNLEIKNVPYCLAAYQKKPEYGPASIVAEDSILSCQSNLLEKGSSIKESGYSLLPNTSSGYQQLYSFE